jgi:predicted unusual protein kinase regulating ubiquinone biosynthesis (AarF/ABC1/UbiB family)
VLQDHAPFVDYTVVRKIIEEDLGAPPEVLFKEFDKVPLAAASLAQVHHAVAHDGRELAVKVQYPTLRDEFSGDMFTHWLVLNVADMIFDRTSPLLSLSYITHYFPYFYY